MPLCSISLFFPRIKLPLYIFLISDLFISLRIMIKLIKIIPINICMINPPNICNTQVHLLLCLQDTLCHRCKGCKIHIYLQYIDTNLLGLVDIYVRKIPPAKRSHYILTPYQTASTSLGQTCLSCTTEL